MAQIYYLIRSKMDGQYLVARPRSPDPDRPDPGYLLMFREHFDALSYLNTHAKDVVDRFAVESLPDTQMNGLMQRWGFAGVGIVQDPLIPRVEFLQKE
jgi:hypothetical protein